MADELSVYPGQRVLVVDRFKDGWGHGICIDSKQQGAFPLACVSVNPFSTHEQLDAAVVPDANTGPRRRASYAADPDIPQPDSYTAIQSGKYSRRTIYSIYSAYGRMDSSLVEPPSPVYEDYSGDGQGFDVDDAMFVRRVIYEYDAQMEDELDLVVGESVRVLQEFDDNWAIGSVVGSGKRGMFPLVCIDGTNGHGNDEYWSNTRNDQISSRTSSSGRCY
ncbi:Vinexin [Chytriomyces hyalinus]|nr:Vinexin [Chytriomyces hyalinus]